MSDQDNRPTPDPQHAATTKPPEMNGGSPVDLDPEALGALVQGTAVRVERIDREVEALITLAESHADTLQAVLLNQEKMSRTMDTLLKQQETTQALLKRALATSV